MPNAFGIRQVDLANFLHSAIAAASRSGVKQVELVRITGYSRERIRQITRTYTP